MTPPLIALESTRHRTHGWHRPDHFRFASDRAWAPLMLSELATALPIYPIGFMKPAGTSGLPVALLGLHEGENLFLDVQGRWLAPYVPAYFRAYPFSIHEAVAGEQRRQVLCIDTSSGLYREQPDHAQGELRFFTDEGQPQPVTQQLVNFMQALQAASPTTQRAVHQLDAAGLLVPWELPAPQQDGGSAPGWPGLCRVDEGSLNRLDANTLLELRNSSALGLAYAQLLSMGRVGKLHRLAGARRAAAAAASAPAPDLSLAQALFEPGESDTIKFNW